MITKPTVLILGAGASRPYGFPLGTELSRKIIENLRNSNSAEFSALQMMDFDADYIKDFVNSFQSSFQTSIDAFLEHREDCIQIGRVAIAQVIIPHENVMNLIDAKAEDDWYKYLFKRMNASFDYFGDNGLSVMTYNYDRSFEHFVFTALKNTHNKTDTQVADKLSSIPIIHLHGRLGALPWEQYYGQYYCRSYSPSASSGDLRNSAEGIKIIYQDI